MCQLIDEVEVTLYQTDHQQGWVDLAGLLDGPTLRGLTGYSQNSIRRIDWDQFASAVEVAAGPTALKPVAITQEQIIGGGRTPRQVSVRIGQPAFRAELVRKYGSVCAFSGPAPGEALEACHLYSYAEVGRHDIEGGLPAASRSAPALRSRPTGGHPRWHDRRRRLPAAVRPLLHAARPTAQGGNDSAPT